MHRPKAILTLLACLAAVPVGARDFNGDRALEFTRQAVSFGPRPPGSPAMKKLQAWMLSQLKPLECEVIQDDFTATTPHGPVAMLATAACTPDGST